MMCRWREVPNSAQYGDELLGVEQYAKKKVG